MRSCPQSRRAAGVSRPFSVLRFALTALLGLSVVGCATERSRPTAPLPDTDAFVVSWEAIPSLQMALPNIDDPGYRERDAVARAVREEVLPLVLAAVRIDASSAQTRIEPGGYLGKTGVSLQTSLDAERTDADRLAAALGYVLRQHSVLVSHSGTQATAHRVVRIGFPYGVLDAPLAHRFFQHAGSVDKGLLGGYRGAGDELWFINLRDAAGQPYSGLQDAAFARALHTAAASFREVPTMVAGSARIEAWLIANDWQQAPDGEQYLSLLQRGDPGVQAPLDAARRAHNRIVLEAAARYGWH